MTIERAHTIILKAGGDTARDLAHELHHLAEQVARGDLTVGCSGGPSCGSSYSYRHDPAMTHDEYFRLIEAQIEAERAEPKFTVGHCENNNQPGGCQMHNLHCGWPDCDRRPRS